ncbi:MAG TPA: glycosyltransferase family 39 protein, partial [Tepidisphaeraceae bacterium]|nr:glycosyltransferase family 39 protein [Tepidisphaeraceae bacterium]
MAGKASGNSAQPPADKRRGFEWVQTSLVLILLVAAALRVYAAQTTPLWLDEIWSLELACGRDTAHEHLPINVLLSPAPALTTMQGAAPWWHIWSSMRNEPHPPPFFILLRFFRDVLGSTDLAARTLSMLASLVCIVLVFRCVKELSGNVPALWAAALMAFSGQQIAYGIELRSYSLIMMLTLAACAALIAIERRGPRFDRVLALGLFSFLAVLTHYFAVGAIFGLAAYAAVRLRGTARRNVLIAFIIAGVAFCIFWGPHFLQQRSEFDLERYGAVFLKDEPRHHLSETVFRLLRVPAAALWPTELITPVLSVRIVTWVIAALFAGILLVSRKQKDLLIWVLIVAGACAVPLALDLVRGSKHLAYDRYIVLITPGICGILAVAGASTGGWKRHALPAMMTLVCLVAIPSTLSALADRFDWQVAGTTLAEHAAAGDGVIIAAQSDEVRQAYLNIQQYAPVSHYEVALVTEPIGKPLAASLRARPHTWAVFQRTTA